MRGDVGAGVNFHGEYSSQALGQGGRGDQGDQHEGGQGGQWGFQYDGTAGGGGYTSGGGGYTSGYSSGGGGGGVQHPPGYGGRFDAQQSVPQAVRKHVSFATQQAAYEMYGAMDTEQQKLQKGVDQNQLRQQNPIGAVGVEGKADAFDYDQVKQQKLKTRFTFNR